MRGQGSGVFSAGQTAEIIAGPALAGKVFKCWRGDGAAITDLMSPTTGITIPAWNPVVVAAIATRACP